MNELISLEKIAQWQKLKTLVLDSVSSPLTKRVYNMALDDFMGWFQPAPRPGFTKATVSAWRASLEDRRLGRHEPQPTWPASSDGRHLEPEPTEQAAVTEIQGLRRQGYTLRGIAATLNRRGFRSRRGTEWRLESVTRVLKQNTLPPHPKNA